MGNCFSQLKKSKVAPQGKPVTSSPAKNKSRRSSFFGRKNTNIGTNNSKCQLEVPAACQLTASKHEVDKVCEPSTNTSCQPKKRPLSTSTFIVPYENSLLRKEQQLRESRASKATVESSSTPWPASDTSSQGSSSSSFLSDDEASKQDKKTDEESWESDEDDDQSCATLARNVVVRKPQRPKKNIWRMPVYTDPLIVGDNRKPKTAFETWTAEVDKLLLGDACEADLLLYDLDEIIPGNQDRATYRCELPRPKTRRGRATVPSQVGSSNKAVPTDKENNIKVLQCAEGGNKKQQVSTDPGRGVLDKSAAVAVKKCVRFVDVPEYVQSLSAEDASDGPEKDRLDERLTAPEKLVYDEAELVLIDEIEKEFGIT